MKVRSIEIEVEPTFKPKTMEITFESQNEMDAMLCLFNYSPICNFLRDNNVNVVSTAEVLVDFEAHSSDKWREFLKAVESK